MSVNICIGYYI